MVTIISLILMIAIFWYFYNHLESNGYWTNFAIYFVIQIISNLLQEPDNLISTFIGCAIGTAITIKIMEYARAHTASLFGFIAVCIVLSFIISFIITFILSFIFATFLASIFF